MADRSAFIEAILAAPDDDTPRLVFADWLEEHGEPHRAEFIRVQCEAARLPADDPRQADLAHREDELLRDHGDTLSPVEEVCRTSWRMRHGGLWHGLFRGQLDWHRGFPRRFRVNPAEFVRTVADVLRDEAVFEVELEGGAPDSDGPWLDELCASPRLPLVSSLSFVETHYCFDNLPDNFVRLVQSPHLTGLEHVSVFMDYVGVKGVRALATSPTPFRLRTLYLGCFIEPCYAEVGQVEDFLEAIRLIGNSPRTAVLRALSIDSHYDAEGRGDDVARILLASPTLPATMALHFDTLHEVSADTRQRLTERFRLVPRE